MKRFSQEMTAVLAVALVPSLWVRHAAGENLISSGPQLLDVFRNRRPNVALSLDFLQAKYPDIYNSESTWSTFFDEGIHRLHVPSELFLHYANIQERLGLLTKPRIDSVLLPAVATLLNEHPIYASTLLSCLNEIQPTFAFSPLDYYQLNPDVIEAAVPAHAHFIAVGCFEMRRASRSLDTTAYNGTHTRALQSKLEDVYASRFWQGKPANPLTCALALTPVEEIEAAFKGYTNLSPPVHTRRVTAESAVKVASTNAKVVAPPTPAQSLIDKIRSRKLLDERFYKRNRLPVESDAVQHYVAVGEREGLRPNSGFDPVYYLAAYPDIRRNNQNALVHFDEIGRREGRRGASIDDVRMRAASSWVVLVGDPKDGASLELLKLVQFHFFRTNRAVLTIFPTADPRAALFMEFGFVLQAFESKADLDVLRRIVQGRSVALVYFDGVGARHCFDAETYKSFSEATFVTKVRDTALEEITPGSAPAQWSPASKWILESCNAQALLAKVWGIAPEDMLVVGAFGGDPQDGASDRAGELKRAKADLGLTDSAIVVIGVGGGREGVGVLERFCQLPGAAGFVFHPWGVRSPNERGEDILRDRRVLSAADVILMMGLDDGADSIATEAALLGTPIVYAVTASVPSRAYWEDHVFDLNIGNQGNILALLRRIATDDQNDLRRNRNPVGPVGAEKLVLVVERLLWEDRWPPRASVIVTQDPISLHQRVASAGSQSVGDVEIIILTDENDLSSLAATARYRSDPRVTIVSERTPGTGLASWAKAAVEALSSRIFIHTDVARLSTDESLRSVILGHASENVIFQKSGVSDDGGELLGVILQPI